MKTTHILCTLLLAPLAALHAADVPKPKPNVLLILADDMGWGDVRCHGNEKISTPVLDKLQRQSVELMYAIARLLPPEMRGRYAS